MMITTERLTLRRASLDDFPAYAMLFSNPDAMRHISGEPPSTEKTWARFLWQTGGWHHLGFGYFVAIEQSTGRLVGLVGFQDLKRDLSPSIEGTLEAGWIFHPDVHGRGYAGEAATACFKWAKDNFAGRRATAIISPANAPSLKIAGRLGMREFARTIYHANPVILFERTL